MSTEWNSDGQKYCEGKYVNNRREGIWTYYTPRYYKIQYENGYYKKQITN